MREELRGQAVPGLVRCIHVRGQLRRETGGVGTSGRRGGVWVGVGGVGWGGGGREEGRALGLRERVTSTTTGHLYGFQVLCPEATAGACCKTPQQWALSCRSTNKTVDPQLYTLTYIIFTPQHPPPKPPHHPELLVHKYVPHLHVQRWPSRDLPAGLHLWPDGSSPHLACKAATAHPCSAATSTSPHHTTAQHSTTPHNKSRIRPMQLCCLGPEHDSKQPQCTAAAVRIV
jgi:hypothetical protein